ncbi:hypothetical protein KHQ81_10885 [Mycoplasmatota bacterium]|nr:hypothetical protein KHQ81_10885 [Mycoplasmatota bacterium]
MKKFISYLVVLTIFMSFAFITNINVNAEDFDYTHWIEQDDRVYLQLGDDQDMGGATYLDGIELYSGDKQDLFGLYSDINVIKPDIVGLKDLYFLVYDAQGKTFLREVKLGTYDDVGTYPIMVEEESQTELLIYAQSFSNVQEIDTNQVWTLYFTKTDSKPVINGETAFITNVDSPKSVDEIQSRLSAFDNEDGDISSNITVVTDNYTANKNTVGDWHIIFSVTDSSGNTSTLDCSVLVRDAVSPEIYGTYNYTQSMTTLLDVNTTVLNALSVDDNYDSDLPITLKTDNYTANYNIVGTYTVTYECFDTSGNYDTYDVTIEVIDDVKPTFTGPLNIVKNSSETLTISDIQSQLTANDNKDGNITDSITIKTDNYTGRGHIKGTYTVIFEVKDLSNNVQTHTVTIEVMDDIPPVFFTDNYFITVAQSVTLTNQDIIDLLTATNQIEVVATTSVMTLSNEYLGNETTIGMYAVTYKVTSVDGSEDTISTVVNVIEDESDDTVTITPEEPVKKAWYISVWEWICWLFKTIWNWIVNLL